MQVAGLWGDLSVIEDLILMGADVNAGGETTALRAAVMSGERDLINLLLKHSADPSNNAGSWRSHLTAAVENKNGSTIQLLVSHGADPADESALLLAMEENPGVFNTLLKIFSARYPKGKKTFGGNLLIKAVKDGDTTLLNSMLNAKFDLEDFVEEEGCHLNVLGFAIMDKKGSKDSLSVVQHLINAGCDPKRTVRKLAPVAGSNFWPQETALMVAIETRSEKMVKLILKYDTDLYRPAKKGVKRTPLQKACEIGSFKMVKLLLDKMPDKTAAVNEQPAYSGGATALQLAAISGSIKIAVLLLSYKAMVHAAPAKLNGRTAFEGAAEHGRMEMIRVLWNAAALDGIPFTREQIEVAKSLASKQGHIGCAEYIEDLTSKAIGMYEV